MASAPVRLLDDDVVVLRKTGVHFPVELRPAQFKADELGTWPDVEGRLEWVGGRLLYMPPCADVQQEVVGDVVYLLRTWSEGRPEFVVGTNEAGMKLGDDIRAADAAVWRRAEVGPSVGHLRSAPPVLAAEVAGQDEDEPALRAKAEWYLTHGVGTVWLVLPETFEVVVVRADGEKRFALGEALEADARLPGLSPSVDRFFTQLRR